MSLLDFIPFERRVKDGSSKRIGKYQIYVEKDNKGLWRLYIYQKGVEKFLFKSIEYSKREIVRLYKNITNLKDINKIIGER